MIPLHEKTKELLSHRWLVFVCAIWLQSFAGISYIFGSISPAIKSSMGYNQKQLALIGVAKDLGDNIGFLAGKISEVSPIWRVLLVGAFQNSVGYGLVWLVVTHRFPSLPLWALFIMVFIGTNATTYYNTASLVSCVQNFPENRGPVVGILKGFVGLSSAILTQILAMINTPDQASLIFIIAVGPAMVAFSLMFIIRPVNTYKQARPSDNSSFLFIYSICLLLAAYLMGVLLLENLMDLDQNTIRLFGVILIFLILLPLIIPILFVFFLKPKAPDSDQETLLLDPAIPEVTKSNKVVNDDVVDDCVDQKVEELPLSEGPKEIVRFQANLFRAVKDAVKKIKQKNGPRRGEDFTLTQALVKADLWLLFLALCMGSGSGLTIINNMGQICQSLGDNDPNVYVSMFSILNFLGRVGGGYFSELIVRNFAYPRLVAMAMVEVMMAFGFTYYVMGWAGQIYVLTIVIGLGYGAHWSIGLATASELFGLKNFGSVYNFLTMASPGGSLILSGLIASTLYDYYAEQQAKQRLGTSGANFDLMLNTENKVLVCEGKICYSLTCGILAGVCLFATLLSLVVVHRTKKVYAQLYGSSRT